MDGLVRRCGLSVAAVFLVCVVVVFVTAVGSAASPVSRRGLARRLGVSIASISPAQGFRGDTVAITGNGFGGPNVRVTVGGVAAQVLSATGSSVSFVVPAGAPLGQTRVRATNPGGQFGEIAFTVLFDGKVTPVLDQSRSVQVQIGPAGGTIATGGGITLQIPAGALHDTETITLTPLSAVQGSPLSTLVGGVQLDPQGLHFLVSATLTLPLPAGVDPHQLVGFGFDDAGISFHLKPPTVTGGVISVQIAHFSGGGAGTLSPAQSAAILGYQPTPADELAEQQISAALY
jgi:IPT/TIG domain-containing protein